MEPSLHRTQHVSRSLHPTHGTLSINKSNNPTEPPDTKNGCPLCSLYRTQHPTESPRQEERLASLYRTQHSTEPPPTRGTCPLCTELNIRSPPQQERLSSLYGTQHPTESPHNRNSCPLYTELNIPRSSPHKRNSCRFCTSMNVTSHGPPSTRGMIAPCADGINSTHPFVLHPSPRSLVRLRRVFVANFGCGNIFSQIITEIGTKTARTKQTNKKKLAATKNILFVVFEVEE